MIPRENVCTFLINLGSSESPTVAARRDSSRKPAQSTSYEPFDFVDTSSPAFNERPKWTFVQRVVQTGHAVPPVPFFVPLKLKQTEKP